MPQTHRQSAVERRHSGSGPMLASFEAACVLSVVGLILTHAWRFSSIPSLHHGWMLIVILAAWPTADFIGGIVHWTADTWGSESMPWLGPRFLTPFRVHHVTPQSFLKCNFWDTNGDNCLVCLPFLIAVFWIPTDHPVTGGLAVFLTALSFFASPTNQIHQWAHMEHPPYVVRGLQRARLILPAAEHGRHHCHPHASNYCITTGWCNPVLESAQFFPRLEKLITRLTGAIPRFDEESHRAHHRPGEKPGLNTPMADSQSQHSLRRRIQ